MELAMQVFSNDETVRKFTVQNLKEFNSQCSSTQAIKGDQFTFYDACYQKSF